LMFLPIQDPLHCNEDQSEESLEDLKEDGKIVEFEPGKYKPTTEKLRGIGGD
jgi:hypothetical protein